MQRAHRFLSLFFFNDTATTEIYTLSLHDALPICAAGSPPTTSCCMRAAALWWSIRATAPTYRRRWRSSNASLREKSSRRSEEHTSELQSQSNLVCRLLLEKKKNRSRSRASVFVRT